MARQLVFSVTAADCDWSYTRGTGSGGQKKNKTNSAVHCIHRPSGAHGYSEGSRSQAQNRREAFVRMVETKEFSKWRTMEFARRTGAQAAIEETVNREMKKVRVDVKQDGKWVAVDKDAALLDLNT